MFGIGSTELMLIFGVALFVLGPERSIQLAKKSGELLRKIKTDWAHAKNHFDLEANPPPKKSPPKDQ
ncbi:MAG: hypothetical protein COX62_07925 [Deltaproteobacteria bacterium CG_4_10_14_0_2_um_filter_43_8]|nr:MAG: hypothetical protein COV43_04665 [Deltaproteobacteria bacterium CG11_big_fil_rev_8_21_14_0_20_42_23]PJA18857.1 MAG: hypothetical protein COX62_07925 [Deltaproteobacteria bacterium CG_4_10_14_0_2_um_filter_43_8]PJC65068.1 MAG: hypothetical protein CO021_01055 [Deltaproteobacteria bacterium CG_4_9_14_0_2_um_filter_42_21]